MRASGILVIAVVVASCRRPREQASVVRDAQDADSVAAAVRTRDSLVYVRWNLPSLAGTALASDAMAGRYDVFLGLNPYYQRGLFDADTIPDVAVQIVELATGKRGIAIVHGGDKSIHILGAGTPLGASGDDLEHLWVWRVEPAPPGLGLPTVGQDVLYVEKPESAGAIIWWNGARYARIQHGD